MGMDDCCNTTKPLARAFNGSATRLTYSAPDDLNDSYSPPILNWVRRYVRRASARGLVAAPTETAIARPKGGGLVEVYLGFFYMKGCPGPRRDADPRGPPPRREATHRQLPSRLHVRRREVGGRLEMGLRGCLMHGALYPLVVLRARGPNNFSSARASSAARQPRDRQRVRHAISASPSGQIAPGTARLRFLCSHG